MMKLYHPDKQAAKVQSGIARYGDLDTYERKIQKVNIAAQKLDDPVFRAQHAREVKQYKAQRGVDVQKYNEDRRSKK